MSYEKLKAEVDKALKTSKESEPKNAFLHEEKSDLQTRVAQAHAESNLKWSDLEMEAGGIESVPEHEKFPERFEEPEEEPVKGNNGKGKGVQVDAARR